MGAAVLLVAQLAVVHCAILPAALQRELPSQLAERLGVQLELRAFAAVGWPPAACGVPPPHPLQARVGRQPGPPAPHCRQVRETWRYYSDHKQWSSRCKCQRENRSDGFPEGGVQFGNDCIVLLEIFSELIVRIEAGRF